jgi:type VI protein secretion system component VasK
MSTLIEKMYNPLTKLVRRIIRIMKESYSALFAIIIGGILAVLVVVGQPLFTNLVWNSWEVVLLRLLVASPLIAFFILIAVFMSKQMKKIDDANDTKLKDAIVKDVVKALKEQDNDANQSTSNKADAPK